jgi:hypothetical protein
MVRQLHLLLLVAIMSDLEFKSVEVCMRGRGNGGRLLV